ncbi:MAG: hypothetical protein WC758_07935 [Candidatus Woesearchaeota archaeon]|jgi:hypothetical protein
MEKNKKEEEIKLKEVFGDKRVLGLAGEKNSGKTNNLMALLKDFRNKNKTTEIYVFGLEEQVLNWVKKFENVFEISSLEQLRDKKDSLIILDEFQRLRLNDRRYRDLLNDFIDFIYHNNNWVIFSSPNLREFNSIICGKIERWALKSLRLKDLICGSQLKEAVLGYNGRFKCINDISIEPEKLLIINEDYERVIELDYIKDVDTKFKSKDIFE